MTIRRRTQKSGSHTQDSESSPPLLLLLLLPRTRAQSDPLSDGKPGKSGASSERTWPASSSPAFAQQIELYIEQAEMQQPLLTSSTWMAAWMAASNSRWTCRAVTGENDTRSPRLCAVRPPERTRTPSFLSFVKHRNQISVKRCNIPEVSNRFTNLPIGFGIERGVDGDLYDWDVCKLFTKHDSEGHKDAMIETRSLETPTIVSSRFCSGR